MDKPLTPAEFAARIENIYTPKIQMHRGVPLDNKPYLDQPRAHQEADELLAELLKSLGYGEGIEMYENATHWYE
jgi:hypothetical protein